MQKHRGNGSYKSLQDIIHILRIRIAQLPVATVMEKICTKSTDTTEQQQEEESTSNSSIRDNGAAIYFMESDLPISTGDDTDSVVRRKQPQ